MVETAPLPHDVTAPAAGEKTVWIARLAAILAVSAQMLLLAAYSLPEFGYYAGYILYTRAVVIAGIVCAAAAAVTLFLPTLKSKAPLAAGFALSLAGLALLLVNWAFKYENHRLYLELVPWLLWSVIAFGCAVRLFPRTPKAMWTLRLLLLTVIFVTAALLYSRESPTVMVVRIDSGLEQRFNGFFLPWIGAAVLLIGISFALRGRLEIVFHFLCLIPAIACFLLRFPFRSFIPNEAAEAAVCAFWILLTFWNAWRMAALTHGAWWLPALGGVFVLISLTQPFAGWQFMWGSGRTFHGYEAVFILGPFYLATAAFAVTAIVKKAKTGRGVDLGRPVWFVLSAVSLGWLLLSVVLLTPLTGWWFALIGYGFIGICLFWRMAVAPRRRTDADQYPPLGFIRVYKK